MLEMGQRGFEKPMPRVDFRERDWATLSGRADEDPAEENVVLILSEHSVFGADGTTKLLAGGSKPKDAKSHKFRTCK